MAKSTVDNDTERTTVDKLLYSSADPRLRATWRVLIPLLTAVAFYVAGHLLVEVLLNIVAGENLTGGNAVLITAIGLMTLTVLIALSGGAGLVVASRLDRRSVRSYGFAFSGRWVSDFIAGVLIGIIASVSTVSYQVLRGYSTLNVEFTGLGVNEMVFAPAVLLVFVMFYLSNNLFEEVIFRAIVIPTTAEGLHGRYLGRTTAVLVAVVVSLPLFGALHLLGGGLSAVVTSAAGGILFATAYVLTGQLGLPVGVHFGGVAILSILQSPISVDPELTFPSVVIAEWATSPSLAVSVELWIVRLLVGVFLICFWVFRTYGDLSTTKRFFPNTDSSNPGAI
ncbi:CPBP family glutamic-type intramembrane protease [Natronococcus sp. A-GB7]|uniref:CPBP family glutamic-type intramembrane protease n=1 Tax=Natronococcus sp. A-GB7 TaxID=3037649 RepID=UPI00241F82A7|nr:CPBP family glutamic-type intramembrane protease [Natronococcus sp. A-GB7]MDG5821718.1 CPBP family glutamic-type intramembrane protease [Natronococcus sp. A-GB7]